MSQYQERCRSTKLSGSLNILPLEESLSVNGRNRARRGRPRKTLSAVSWINESRDALSNQRRSNCFIWLVDAVSEGKLWLWIYLKFQTKARHSIKKKDSLFNLEWRQSSRSTYPMITSPVSWTVQWLLYWLDPAQQHRWYKCQRVWSVRTAMLLGRSLPAVWMEIGSRPSTCQVRSFGIWDIVNRSWMSLQGSSNNWIECLNTSRHSPMVGKNASRIDIRRTKSLNDSKINNLRHFILVLSCWRVQCSDDACQSRQQETTEDPS